MIPIIASLAVAALWLVVPQEAYPQDSPQHFETTHEPAEQPELPARHAVEIPDSARKKVGYQHWKGAAIGTVAGAAGLALLTAVAGSGCYDCGLEQDVFKTALLGAGLGGAFGFLVGAASPKYRWVPAVEESATDSASEGAP